MVAGVAAGMAAVFRTRSAPLCWPSRCSTETTSKPRRWSRPFLPASSPTRWSSRSSASRRCSRTRPVTPSFPAHLPLYALLAVLVAALRRCSWRRSGRAAALGPSAAARLGSPAIGGAALGLFAVPLISSSGRTIGTPGQRARAFWEAATARHRSRSPVPTGFPPAGAAPSCFSLLCVAKLIATAHHRHRRQRR